MSPTSSRRDFLAYATAVACLLFILWRGVKRGLIAGAIFTAAAAAIFGLINMATGGQWWINIILANINEFIPGQMEGLYRQWYDLHLILIGLSAAFVVRVFANKPRSDDQSRRLYGLWVMGAAANGALAGKWGAGESYFMTAIAGLCLCAGILLGEWRRAAAQWRPPFQWATAILIPILLIAQAGRFVHLPTQGRLFEPVARLLNLPTDSPYYDSQGYTQLGRPPNAIDVEQGYKILAYTQAAGGPVITEEAAFSLLAGKEQVGNPTQLLNLAKNNLLDDDPLIAMIDQHAFDVIVLKAQFYPLPVLQAIGQNYQTVDSIVMNNFSYTVLKPRKESGNAP